MAWAILFVFLMALSFGAGFEINWYITDPEKRSPFILASAIQKIAIILFFVIRVAITV